jgi:hypothetical protein
MTTNPNRTALTKEAYEEIRTWVRSVQHHQTMTPDGSLYDEITIPARWAEDLIATIDYGFWDVVTDTNSWTPRAD